MPPQAVPFALYRPLLCNICYSSALLLSFAYIISLTRVRIHCTYLFRSALWSLPVCKQLCYAPASCPLTVSICDLLIGMTMKFSTVFNRASRSGSGSVFGIRILIRIQEGKNDPQKEKIHVFEVLDGLFCELQASSVTCTYFMEA